MPGGWILGCMARVFCSPDQQLVDSTDGSLCEQVNVLCTALCISLDLCTCVLLCCSWLIAIAYWLAGGFIKSGLGNRIAYSMVRQHSSSFCCYCMNVLQAVTLSPRSKVQCEASAMACVFTPKYLVHHQQLTDEVIPDSCSSKRHPVV